MSAVDLAPTPPAKGLRSAGAHRTTLLFLLCFILAQADQQVMGLLAVPIQDSFRLTNSELGLLQGFAFSMAYALGGLPIARLLDGGNRVRIASVCVGLWSFATMACGLANSFLLLLLLRALTAVTEAGLPPAAFSIFSQDGDHRQTARRTSTFMLAPFIGGGLVWMLGGMLLGTIPGRVLPLPGWSSPWRAVFLAVGLPGLVLGPLLAIVAREPKRVASSAIAAPLPPYAAVLRTIFIDSPFLRYYFLALTAFYMLSAAVSGWYPAFLVRELHVSPAAAGGYAGSIFLGAGVLGVLASNMRATFRKDTSIAAMVRDFIIAGLLLIPVSFMMMRRLGLETSLVFYAVYAFLSAAIVASMAVPIQLSLDSTMKARGLALSSLCMSAFAGSTGPLVVGLLSDGGHLSLSAALSVTGVTAIICGAALFGLAYRALRNADDPRGSGAPANPEAASARI